jgi:hypothetical protein
MESILSLLVEVSEFLQLTIFDLLSSDDTRPKSGS